MLKQVYVRIIICKSNYHKFFQVIIPYRCDFYDVQHLKQCGDLGQVLFHPFDLRDEDSILKCIKYSNVVINCIGREWETKNFKYDDVNVEGAARLARICKQNGVERFIHLSCLNATPEPEVNIFCATFICNCIISIT